MQSKANLFITIVVAIVCLLASEVPVFACATCGCSEVCPLAVMDTNGAEGDRSILSNSIWGNIILKMAYAQDPEIIGLAKKLRITGMGTTSGLAGVAGGTAAQGIVGMATLNPPDGIPDSYAPGVVGLGLEAAVLMIFAGGPLVQHKYRKKLKARQLAIRQKVEVILQHLEISKTDCSEAQKDLAALVGNRGAQECVQLWQSSHRMVTTSPPAPKISALDEDAQQ